MRIFLLGAAPSFVAGTNDSSAEKLAKTGGNTGNQIIAYSLLKELKCCGCVASPGASIGREHEEKRKV